MKVLKIITFHQLDAPFCLILITITNNVFSDIFACPVANKPGKLTDKFHRRIIDQ